MEQLITKCVNPISFKIFLPIGSHMPLYVNSLVFLWFLEYEDYKGVLATWEYIFIPKILNNDKL